MYSFLSHYPASTGYIEEGVDGGRTERYEAPTNTRQGSETAQVSTGQWGRILDIIEICWTVQMNPVTTHTHLKYKHLKQEKQRKEKVVFKSSSYAV